MGIIENSTRKLRNATIYEVSPPFPRKIQLEPTGKCNVDCIFCHNRGSRYRQQGMEKTLPIDFGQKILLDAYELGAREVGLSFRGEPLLHPRLDEFILCAAKTGYEYIFFSTNGTLASEERMLRLFKSGLRSVAFSLNAGNAKIYERIHGLDAFDLVLDNLRSCVRLRDNWKRIHHGQPPLVMVSCITTPESENSVDELLSILAPLSLDDVRVGKQNSVLTFRQDNVCWRLFADAIITEDGYLTTCCRDSDLQLAVADLHSVGLADAWHSMPAKVIRNKMLAGNLHGTLCGECIFGYDDDIIPLLS